MKIRLLSLPLRLNLNYFGLLVCATFSKSKRNGQPPDRFQCNTLNLVEKSTETYPFPPKRLIAWYNLVNMWSLPHGFYAISEDLVITLTRKKFKSEHCQIISIGPSGLLSIILPLMMGASLLHITEMLTVVEVYE